MAHEVAILNGLIQGFILAVCFGFFAPFSSGFGFLCARTFIKTKQKYPTCRITRTMPALMATVTKSAPSYNDHIVTMMVVNIRPNMNFGNVIATPSCCKIYHKHGKNDRGQGLRFRECGTSWKFAS